LVPKVIAEGWNKVSNGLVTLTAPDADPNPRAELAAERAKTAALEAKIAAMEARHRELEQKARKSA
jgi:BMFP domain-containing protein YqiC